MNEKNIPVLFERLEDCCGCSACMAACPIGAIVMVADAEGFEYPRVNEEKCIGCFKCLRVCPLRTARKA